MKHTRPSASRKRSHDPACSIATRDHPHTASADTRHSAAYRMARDPGMPICDVRWVLGHAQLSTTQLYTSPLPEDVIASVLAHHERRAQQQPQAPVPARYRPESLTVLFGTDR